MRHTKMLIGIIVALLIIAFLSIIAFATPVLITLTNPTTGNQTTFSTAHQTFNYTTNISSRAGNYSVGFPNGTQQATASMSNSSTTSWGINITFITADTPFNSWHNITFTANDTGTGGNQSTSGVYLFKRDTTVPIVARYAGSNGNWTVFNDTRTGNLGNWLNVTFNTSDTSIDSCGIRLYSYSNLYASPAVINGGLLGGAAQNRNCSAQVNSSQITPDGSFIIEYFANDTAGNMVYGTENETGVKMTLRAGKWTLIAYNGVNNTYGLNNITRIFPMTTYTAAKFDNAVGYKNYTVYSSATPSINNNTKLYVGDSFWLYNGDSADVSYLEHAYFTSNYVGTLRSNISLVSDASTDWNYMGIIATSTINKTLWGYSRMVGLNASSSLQNITAIAFWNQTENDWITCITGFDSCSGNWSVTNSIPIGYGVAVAVNMNMTFNRTTYTVTNTAIGD